MTKQEIAADLRRETKGGMITATQLAKYMTVKDSNNVKQYLYGLERVNKKYYFINDVAASLKERAEVYMD